jgi:hypothetical protein
MLVTLEGGLGNQLFQYAAGWLVSKQNSEELFVDVTRVLESHDRVGLLGFELEGTFIRDKSLGRRARLALFRHSKYYRDVKCMDVGSMRENLQLFHEEEDAIKPSRVLESPRESLKGWFQSEVIAKKFISQRGLPLKLKFSANFKFRKIIERIEQTNSILIHVRRGDYLKNPFWGVLSEEYYLAALKHFSQSRDLTIFLISDDEMFARDFGKKLANLYDVTVIPNESGITAAEFLSIMSNCKKYIIGNSTYSWWSAVLARSHDVVAPANFYRGFDSNIERYPPEWILEPSIWEESNEAP